MEKADILPQEKSANLYLVISSEKKRLEKKKSLLHLKLIIRGLHKKVITYLAQFGKCHSGKNGLCQYLMDKLYL